MQLAVAEALARSRCGLVDHEHAVTDSGLVNDREGLELGAVGPADLEVGRAIERVVDGAGEAIAGIEQRFEFLPVLAGVGIVAGAGDGKQIAHQMTPFREECLVDAGSCVSTAGRRAPRIRSGCGLPTGGPPAIPSGRRPRWRPADRPPPRWAYARTTAAPGRRRAWPARSRSGR